MTVSILRLLTSWLDKVKREITRCNPVVVHTFAAEWNVQNIEGAWRNLVKQMVPWPAVALLLKAKPSVFSFKWKSDPGNVAIGPAFSRLFLLSTHVDLEFRSFTGFPDKFKMQNNVPFNSISRNRVINSSFS